MIIRRIAWIAFCTCGARLLRLECLDPVVASDPDFGLLLISGVSAMLRGATSGAYLLLGYLGR